jgi:hypothetical protein
MASLRLTYEELGQRLGLTTEAARQRARRRQREGRWNIVPGNERVRSYVLLDEADLAGEAPAALPVRTGFDQVDEQPDNRPYTPDVSRDVRALMAELRQELAERREQGGKLAEAEARVAALQVELARAQAERGAARAVAISDVEAARRVAEETIAAKDQVIEELRRQLEHERAMAARPWWKRWLLG